LLQEDVSLQSWGLVVIDEQHKFRRQQRDARCAAWRIDPHYLVMRQLPIPRTLALSVFGISMSLPFARRRRAGNR